MSDSKKSSANADKKGVAIITSFRYYKGLCFATLSNGVQGIIGDAQSMPLGVMLTLKGGKIAYEYVSTTADGHDRYALSFDLTA